MENLLPYLLNVGVYAPLAGAAAIALGWPIFGDKSSRATAVFCTAISLVAAIVLWGYYIAEFNTSVDFAFASSGDVLGVRFPAFGLNSVSMPLFALAAIVGFAATLWAAKTEIRGARLYYLLLLTM